MRINFIVSMVLASALALPVSALAQGAQLKLDLGNLASRAKESVNISIDKNTVDWAMQALKPGEGDKEKLRELMKDLEGITVQSFEFDKDKAPSMEELMQAARGVLQELDGQQWKPIINVTDKHGEGTEIVRMSLRKDAAGKIGGFALLAIEPDEIVLVSVIGNIRLDQLDALGKALGQPGMLGQLGGSTSPKAKQ